MSVADTPHTLLLQEHYIQVLTHQTISLVHIVHELSEMKCY